MKATDMIDFFIEEAQHHVINDERSKNSDHALLANGRKGGKSKTNPKRSGGKDKGNDSEIICYNCKKPGHKRSECWSKGGGKEGQGPGRKETPKADKAVVAVADDDKNEMFAFTCTSDYANVAEALQIPKSKLGSCINSGASDVYCPDQERFVNYRPIDRSITTADGRKHHHQSKRENYYDYTSFRRPIQNIWCQIS